MKYKKELSEIWHNLNCWQWDNRIGVEPDGWSGMDYSQKSKYISPIKRIIELNISAKTLYHYRIRKIYSCGYVEAILRIKNWGKYIDLLRDKGFIKLNDRDERAYQILKKKKRISRKQYISLLDVDIE